MLNLKCLFKRIKKTRLSEKEDLKNAFMTKELRKKIMLQSKLKNKFKGTHTNGDLKICQSLCLYIKITC